MGYVLKQTADLLGFVGPIALKGIVEFIVERQEGRYAPPAEVTVAGLMRNGWVLAGLMFLAPFLQSTLLQPGARHCHGCPIWAMPLRRCWQSEATSVAVRCFIAGDGDGHR